MEKTNNRHYKKIWGMVGFIVNLSQMIEYNIANILAFNEILSVFDEQDSMYVVEYNDLLRKTDKWYAELDKKELGKVLGEAKNRLIFTEQFIDMLDKIRSERNYYVHTFFKEDLKTKQFQNKPKECIPRLQELIGDMHATNEELVKIFQEMQQEVKMIY